MSAQQAMVRTRSQDVADSKLPGTGDAGPVHILALTDHPADAGFIKQLLRHRQREFRLTHTPLVRDSSANLSNSHTDIALVDVPSGQIDGLDAVRRARAALPGVPLIVLTSAWDDHLAVQALKEGAQDYLLKSQISTTILVQSIRHAIERQRFLLANEETSQRHLRLKDEFLSHVSHELRSPIAAIDQFLSLLLDKIPGELNAEQHEFLEIVVRNTGALRGLIDDLLDTTRAETGKLTVEPACVAAARLVRDAVERYSNAALERGLRLTDEISPGLPLASADPQRAQQILCNLLDNACKFTPSGGRVTVRAGSDPAHPGFLCFSVSDTGTGIAPEVLPHVFERLYQGEDAKESSRKGLGLGLYITKELVTRHGGQIGVDSEPGKGTKFHFTLPAFSVATLLVPLVHAAVASGKTDFMMVTVGLVPAANGNRKRNGGLLAAVAQTLTRCTLPDMDVLLPRFDGPDRSTKFFIVACANEGGASVLTQRIQDQLRALPEFGTERPALQVSSAVLHAAKTGVVCGAEQLLRCLSEQVESRIQDLERFTQHA